MISLTLKKAEWSQYHNFKFRSAAHRGLITRTRGNKMVRRKKDSTIEKSAIKQP